MEGNTEEVHALELFQEQLGVRLVVCLCVESALFLVVVTVALFVVHVLRQVTPAPHTELIQVVLGHRFFLEL